MFDPRYHRSPKLKPEAALKAVDFALEDFDSRKENRRREGPPVSAAFGDFDQPSSDFKPQVDPLNDLPSLDDLFKPFDLESEYPATVDEPYEDLYQPTVNEFSYEDMDTRSPEIIQTLAQAEAQAGEIISAAQAQAAVMMKKARNEAAALVAAMKRRQEQNERDIRQEIEELRQSRREKLKQAEEYLANADSERQAAEEKRLKAEARLTEVADRIAGLEEERSLLNQEHTARLSELEQSKEGVLAEAKRAGFEEGQLKGQESGRAQGNREALEQFQKQVEGFAALAAKLENLYEELWQANSPLMIKLAIEAAEHIVNKELAQSEDLAVQAFKASIDYLSQAHKVTVLVRPQDIAQLELAKAEQRERLGALVKVEFKGDETLGPGDLIIESDIGRLDATVKHRSTQVLEALRKAFEERYKDQDLGSRPSAEPDRKAADDIVDVEYETEAAPQAAGPAEASKLTESENVPK